MRDRMSSLAHTEMPRADRARERERLIGLAGGGSAWEMVTGGMAWLRSHPDDHEIGLLVAAGASELGLATLARERMALLPEEWSEDPGVAALARNIDRMSSDEVPARRIEDNLASALAALRGHRSVDDETVRCWRTRRAGRALFRAGDGNVVARDGEGRWLIAGDLVGAAQRAELGELSDFRQKNAREACRGIILAGINPPAMLRRLHSLTRATTEGYAAPIIVVEPEPDELLDAAAIDDLAGLVADERVELIVGEGWEGDLAAKLLTRTHLMLPDQVVVTPGAGSTLAQKIAPILDRAHAEQRAAHRVAFNAVTCRDSQRDRAWWSDRFGQRVSPSGEAINGGLRILLPISRYSTFVRHSAADLVESLERLGHTARYLTEPNDSSRLSSVGYLREFESFDPDLVALINYPRAMMGKAVPGGVPFVCWVQDAMGHLFDPALGGQQGETDFLYGHIHDAFAMACGYRGDRMRFRFVPASSTKFHDGPVGPELVERLRCDIAYISHQSQPAREHYEFLAAGLENQPILRAALGIGYASLLEMFAEDRPAIELTRENYGAALAQRVLAEAGAAGVDRENASKFFMNCLAPIAERLHRHRMLAWTVEIAQDLGLTLRLYGKGWERHPDFAPYAASPIEHGEELRAAYRCARLCLHASLATNAHQRVLECALSGGLMLRHGPSPDARLIERAVRWQLLERCTPVSAPDENAGDCYVFDRTDPGAPPRSVIEGVFEDPDALYRVPEWMPLEQQRIPVSPSLDQFPDTAFPRAGETLFCSKDELRAIIERSINDPDWRSSTIRAHREAVLAHMTYDSAAVDLLSFVRSKLSAEQTEPRS